MSKKLLAVMAVLAVVGLTACGSGDNDDTSGSGGMGGSAAKDPSTIKVESTDLGDILVDGNGHALYLFTPDGDNATKSTCDAKCLDKWPALMGEPKAGDGVDESLIGTTEGANAQATYGGHPLYYFAADKSAGELKGQGVDGIWYVVDDKGAAIKEAPAPTGGGGY